MVPHSGWPLDQCRWIISASLVSTVLLLPRFLLFFLLSLRPVAATGSPNWGYECHRRMRRRKTSTFSIRMRSFAHGSSHQLRWDKPWRIYSFAGNPSESRRRVNNENIFSLIQFLSRKNIATIQNWFGFCRNVINNESARLNTKIYLRNYQ